MTGGNPDQAATLAPSGDITEALMAKSVWTDSDMISHGIPMFDVAFISVGGGMGSFAMVDTLRIAGVSTTDMVVLTDLDHPHQTYEHLATNSQIPDYERIRSDSSSVMDCIWGWPGYALREAVEKRALAPVMQVLTEPILADFYTPQASQVYKSIRREVPRIGWSSMVRRGTVRTIRRREGGDYFVLFTPDAGTSSTRRVAFRARYIHVAVGYPGVRFTPDLQAYRNTHKDYQRVLNAYEPHLGMYEECLRRPCTVLMRGSGIVASRIVQRIVDDRDKRGARTTIVHLQRNFPHGFQGTKRTFRRPANNGWAYQGFNYSKAAWGGQHRVKLASLEGKDRSDFIDQLGGTNTAPRASWKEQLARGAREGFYRQQKGTIAAITPSGAALLVTVKAPEGGEVTIHADFIIDATGLEANIEEHRLLNDMLVHVGAGKNPKGRLDVGPNFQIRGTNNGAGRIYASGSSTLGGYYAGVDSFLGLQYAAMQIHDALAAEGFCKKLRAGRSVSQWLKWARNKQP